MVHGTSNGHSTRDTQHFCNAIFLCSLDIEIQLILQFGNLPRGTIQGIEDRGQQTRDTLSLLSYVSFLDVFSKQRHPEPFGHYIKLNTIALPGKQEKLGVRDLSLRPGILPGPCFVSFYGTTFSHHCLLLIQPLNRPRPDLTNFFLQTSNKLFHKIAISYNCRPCIPVYLSIFNLA